MTKVLRPHEPVWPQGLSPALSLAAASFFLRASAFLRAASSGVLLPAIPFTRAMAAWPTSEALLALGRTWRPSADAESNELLLLLVPAATAAKSSGARRRGKAEAAMLPRCQRARARATSGWTMGEGPGHCPSLP